jgi:hypothetical protein
MIAALPSYHFLMVGPVGAKWAGLEKICRECGAPLPFRHYKFCRAKCASRFRHRKTYNYVIKIKNTVSKNNLFKLASDDDVVILPSPWVYDIACAVCGDIFYATRRRKYCCLSCRRGRYTGTPTSPRKIEDSNTLANRERDCICHYCHKPFTPSRSPNQIVGKGAPLAHGRALPLEGAIYCSRNCRFVDLKERGNTRARVIFGDSGTKPIPGPSYRLLKRPENCITEIITADGDGTRRGEFGVYYEPTDGICVICGERTGVTWMEINNNYYPFSITVCADYHCLRLYEAFTQIKLTNKKKGRSPISLTNKWAEIYPPGEQRKVFLSARMVHNKANNYAGDYVKQRRRNSSVKTKVIEKLREQQRRVLLEILMESGSSMEFFTTHNRLSDNAKRLAVLFDYVKSENLLDKRHPIAFTRRELWKKLRNHESTAISLYRDVYVSESGTAWGLRPYSEQCRSINKDNFSLFSGKSQSHFWSKQDLVSFVVYQNDWTKDINVARDLITGMTVRQVAEKHGTTPEHPNLVWRRIRRDVFKDITLTIPDVRIDQKKYLKMLDGFAPSGD